MNVLKGDVGINMLKYKIVVFIYYYLQLSYFEVNTKESIIYSAFYVYVTK